MAIGAREVSIGAEGRFITAGATASTDAYLETLLGILRPSKVCTQLIERLDPKTPIVFLCPARDAESDFIYYALAYLTWPRQMQRVAIEPETLSSNVSALDREHTVLILCRFPARPNFDNGQPIGPNLLLVPATASE